jgi:tRNA A-37 threonylcarbamoyl transferase component Bud32
MAINISEDVLIDEVKVLEDSVLGRGSYGVVYTGVYYGARVAVKRLHQIFFDYDTQQEGIRGILRGFSQEWSLLKTLKHPNIVEFFGVYCPQPRSKKERDFCGCHIVCELLVMSLQERITEGPKLTFRQNVDVAKQIASGLRYLHERADPIMHRDLASKNVLLSSSGEAKIADLGVAKILSREKQKQNTRHPGTDSYMPVEVRFAESDYNETIDVFSLGVIILEMTIGRESLALEPFTMTAGSLQIIPERDRRVRDFRDLASTEENIPLEKIISQCLEEKKKRPTAKDVWHDLDKLCSSETYTKCETVHVMQLYSTVQEKQLEQPVEVEREVNVSKEHIADSELNAQLQELTEKNLTLKKECTRLKFDCSRLQSTLATLQEKDNEIANLKSDKNQLLSKVNELSRKCDISDKQRLDICNDLSDALSKMKGMKVSLSDLTERNQMLQSQQIASQSLLKQRNVELEAEVSALKERMQTMSVNTPSSEPTRRHHSDEIRYPESSSSHLPSMMVTSSSLSSTLPHRRRDELVVPSMGSLRGIKTTMGPTVVMPPLSSGYLDHYSHLSEPYTSNLYTSRKVAGDTYQHQSIQEPPASRRPYYSWPSNPGEFSVDDLENEETLKLELKVFRDSIKSLPNTSKHGDVELIEKARSIKTQGDKLKQFLRRSNYPQRTGPRDYMDDEEISTSLQLQKDCDRLLHTVSSIMRCDATNDVMLLKAAKELIESGSVLLANLQD